MGSTVAATRRRGDRLLRSGKLQPVLMRPVFPGGRGLAISPDGKWVATSDGYTTGFRGPIQRAKHMAFASARSKVNSPRRLHGQRMASILPRSSRSRMGTGGSGLWESLPNSSAESRRPQEQGARRAWSKDGKLLASGGEDGTVILWNGETFEGQGRPGHRRRRQRELRLVHLQGPPGGRGAGRARLPPARDRDRRGLPHPRHGRRESPPAALRQGRVQGREGLPLRRQLRHDGRRPGGGHDRPPVREVPDYSIKGRSTRWARSSAASTS